LILPNNSESCCAKSPENITSMMFLTGPDSSAGAVWDEEPPLYTVIFPDTG
jgi:hypothetical protein